jgi:hypothetical protein
VKAASAGLHDKLIAIEENLYQLRITGRQDGMRWPARLIEKLTRISSKLQDADFAPTSQQIVVNRQFTEEIRGLQARVLNKDVAGFNNMLRERNLPVITVAAFAPRNGLQ